MNSKSIDILRKAYKDDNLCALHIDLQRDFLFSQSLHQTFNNVNNFATQLNVLNVKSNWVATTKKPAPASPLKDFRPNTQSENFAIVQPAENDIVLPKQAPDLFHHFFAKTSQSYNPLNHLNNTIIVDGIYSDACVPMTIAGAFKSFNDAGRPLNIILAHDCSDHITAPDAYVSDIKLTIRKLAKLDIDKDPSYSFSHEHSANIIKALTPIPI